MSDENIELYVEILHTTDAAILVSDDGGKTKHWIPNSVIAEIDYHYKVDRNDDATLTLPTWLALKKGLV